MLDGLARRCTEGPGAGVPPLRLALEAVSDEALDGHEEIMRWLLLSPIVQSMTVFELWDDDAFHALATRAVRLARETGALAMLPVALVYRAGVHVFGGELAAAVGADAGGGRDRGGDRQRPLMYAGLLLAAWRGVEAEAMQLHQRRPRDAAREAREGCRRWPATPPPSSTTAWAATRRPSTAPGAAATTATGATPARRLPELVEAATRCGRPEVAAAALCAAGGADARRGHGLGARRPGPRRGRC